MRASLAASPRPRGDPLHVHNPGQAWALRRADAQGSPPHAESRSRGGALSHQSRGRGRRGTLTSSLRTPAPGKGLRPAHPSAGRPSASLSNSQSVTFNPTGVWPRLWLPRGLPLSERHFLLPCLRWPRRPPRSVPAPRLPPRRCASCPPPGTRAPWTRDLAFEDRPPFGWTISGGGRGVDEPHTRASP